jgi:hypothetical protein
MMFSFFSKNTIVKKSVYNSNIKNKCGQDVLLSYPHLILKEEKIMLCVALSYMIPLAGHCQPPY